MQHRVAGGVSLDDGAAQTLQACIENTGTDRSLPSLDLRDSRSATRRGSRGRQGGNRAHCRFERRPRLYAKLAFEQLAACARYAGRGRRESVNCRGLMPPARHETASTDRGNPVQLTRLCVSEQRLTDGVFRFHVGVFLRCKWGPQGTGSQGSVGLETLNPPAAGAGRTGSRYPIRSGAGPRRGQPMAPPGPVFPAGRRPPVRRSTPDS